MWRSDRKSCKTSFMTMNTITSRGNGPALVMIHGWGQTKRAFEPLAESLKGDFRVVTFDLPGHGEARGDGGPYTFERFTNTLADLVRGLDNEPYHLLGWSMGGTVAARYCLEEAGALPKTLTLIASTPRFVAPGKNLGIGQHPAAVKKMVRMIRSDPHRVSKSSSPASSPPVR